MDGFGKDYTSSTPNSPFQGNDVKKLSEEMDFKLKMAHRKRLAIKHFMSTTASSTSKTSVPKTKRMAERNKTQTPNDDHQHYLSRSLSFDSKDSILGVVDAHDDNKNNKLLVQTYDPIKNYLSPRPKFLKYNPHRHREIFDRQKNVTRVKRSASYDAGMRFPKEELESSVDCSSDACSQKEETDIIDTEHEREDAKEHEDEHEDEKEHEHEDEDEKEEEIGDFQENGRWNLNLFLQYLMVIIVLILTTITITSVKSPNPSPAREAIQNFKNLYCKTYGSILRSVGLNFSEVGKLSKSEIDQLGQTQHEWAKKDGDDDMDSNQLEGFETLETKTVQYGKIDVNHDETWSKNDTGQFQDFQNDENEEISYELHEPVILSSQEKIDFDRVEVDKEPEVLEMVVDDIGKKDGNNIGFDETIEAISLARFDPIFSAFIVVFVIILVSLSVVYYSKKLKMSHVETTVAHQNSPNTKNLESFVNSSPLTHKTHSGSLIDSDGYSSSQTKSSYFERSIDSPSYGSFTVEKKIVKKKKSKNAEVMLSPVRRSSRIHYQSVTSP